MRWQDEYIAAFAPFAIEDWPSGPLLTLANEEAIYRLLCDLEIPPFSIQAIMDDMQNTGRAFLSMLLLTAEQRQRHCL